MIEWLLKGGEINKKKPDENTIPTEIHDMTNAALTWKQGNDLQNTRP